MNNPIEDKTLTDAEVRQYQQGMENFARIVSTSNKDLIERYLEQAYLQLPNGAHYPELTKKLSKAQLARAQLAVTFFYDLGNLILRARKLVEQYNKDHKELVPLVKEDLNFSTITKEDTNDNK